MQSRIIYATEKASWAKDAGACCWDVPMDCAVYLINPAQCDRYLKLSFGIEKIDCLVWKGWDLVPQMSSRAPIFISYVRLQ